MMNDIFEIRSGKVPTTSRTSETLLEEFLTFERLLADLSARFANASGDQVETEIESALRQLLEFLDFDRGAIGKIHY